MWKKSVLDSFKVKNPTFVMKTIDLHTGGEPLRVIYDGIPKIEADTLLEYRNIFKKRFDAVRRIVMWEPRGHADMYGAVLLPPFDKEADLSVIFMHNEGFSTMCGHGILAILKLIAEAGLINLKEGVNEIKIEAPAGIVTGFIEMKNGKLLKTYFDNVPSFLLIKDGKINVKGSEIAFDVAYGGAFYAYVDATGIGLELTKRNLKEIIELGMEIKREVSKKFDIRHPVEDDLSFLYGTIFYDGKTGKDEISRNVCIFAEGEVDRSPTGTGVSGRLALHYFKGEIGLDDEIEIESIIGSKFKGRIEGLVDFGGFESVIPRIEGKASVIGKSEFYATEDDEFFEGFFLR